MPPTLRSPVRRDGLIGAVLLSLWLATLCTLVFGADSEYPSRALKLVCPWPPGGIADVRSRQIAERLSRALGQPVVVENKPGASGTLGATTASLAKPDGYTLLFGSVNDLAIAPALDPATHGKLAASLQPVTFIARGPMLLVASPSIGVDSVAGLVALARAKPGQLSYGSSGPNTTHHFAGEQLKRVAGIDLVHVPYKGSAAMIPDLIGGNLAVGIDFAATSEPLVKAGKLKALAILGPKRVSVLPDVPTAKEAGIAGAEAMSWSALMVPAGTPAAAVARLNAEMVKLLRAPDMTQVYESSGYEVVASTPAEFAVFLAQEQVRWARLAKDLGLGP